MKTCLLFLIILFSIFNQACDKVHILDEISDTNTDLNIVSRYGTEKSFDIVTWNIEHFPKNQIYTMHYLLRIIKCMDVDLIAVQEIDGRAAFMQLLDSLEGYDGYLSMLPDYGQHLGFIYKSDFISISEPKQIFVNDDYAFPRAPLIAYVTIKMDNSTIFDFMMIIVHLKAFIDDESKSRRRIACQKLKYYIDTFLITGYEKDIIIMGDFNDELLDLSDDNIFSVFLADSVNYHFLTYPLANQPTYIGQYTSAIDHILVSADVLSEYNGGKTSVLKIDEEFSNYRQIISDHRPVLAQFFLENDN
jgi:endonuclease/exonuclease/phosphatase family metal-dependent hydrolase